MIRIGILNGPNLGRLGKREPHIYGHQTLQELYRLLEKEAASLNVQLDFFQSNHEGALIDQIELWSDQKIDGLIVNPAAYSHTSIALLDALLCANLPSIEVHLSDIKERETFRQHSYTAQACIKTISGFGFKSYTTALKELSILLTKKPTLASA